MRRLARVAKDIGGAVLLGFGTIFQLKPRPDDHWSTRPGVEALAEAEGEAAGPPRG